MGLLALPNSKWVTAGNQAGLKSDAVNWDQGIMESLRLLRTPTVVYTNASNVKIRASSDVPARMVLCGFPSVLNPGQFVMGDSDGTVREVTTDITLAMASNLWGNEKASQWYMVYAIGADRPATTFTLKGMPMMRVASDVAQVISLRNNLNSAGIGYGFGTDELVGDSNTQGYIYIISGSSKGELRPIEANNNNNTTGGTITYGGAALTLAAGDWFVVIPPTNFRWIGGIFNNSGSNIPEFVFQGNRCIWTDVNGQHMTCPTNSTIEDIEIADPLACAAFPYLASCVGWAGATAAINLTGGNAWRAYLGTVDASGGGTVTDIGMRPGELRFSSPCSYWGDAIAGTLTTILLYSRGFEYPAGYLG